MPADGPLTVRTIRELGALASIREVWRTLQTHPWADFDYFVEVLARQKEFLRPHVLVLERAGRPVGIVAGCLRRDSLPWKIGSLTVWRSRARVLRVGGGAVMGESSAASAQAIRDELLAALGRGEADAAYLHQIDSHAELLQCVQRAPWPARDRWARPVGGWVLELPETYAAYLGSRTKNVRRNLKRYSSLLERELGGDFTVVCHRTAADLERLIQDSEVVARQTYHRRMRVGFEDTPELRQLFAHAVAAGWLRGYVLYAKEKPIAFWHGLAYGKTFYTRDTGYDPACEELRPGNYLLSKVIEEHCRTRDTARFDYGIMDLEYKRNFGTARYERSSIYLFAPRPKGLFLSMLRTASGLGDRAARRLLGSRARGWARKLGALGRRQAPAAETLPESDESPAPSVGNPGGRPAG